MVCKIDELKREYDNDGAYFSLLTEWHNSGRYTRRTAQLVKYLHPFVATHSRVLDAGCAAGAMAIELAKIGVQHVCAVDFSSTALDFARANASRHGVAERIHFFQSRLEQLSDVADDTYDVIVAADVMEHIIEPALVLRELCRVCKPGGVLLVETPNILFRQHPWFKKIHAVCNHLGLPDSRNVFPVDPSLQFSERYHVSLMNGPELLQLVESERWRVVKEIPFGWWLQRGAADRLMSCLCRLGGWVREELQYYENTDIVLIARKAG